MQKSRGSDPLALFWHYLFIIFIFGTIMENGRTSPRKAIANQVRSYFFVKN